MTVTTVLLGLLAWFVLSFICGMALGRVFAMLTEDDDELPPAPG